MQFFAIFSEQVLLFFKTVDFINYGGPGRVTIEFMEQQQTHRRKISFESFLFINFNSNITVIELSFGYIYHLLNVSYFCSKKSYLCFKMSSMFF